jgi:iron-sulfur cluster repair protein YtfE (RIC family)
VYEPVSRSDPFGILVAEHALLRQQFARALGAAGDGADPSSIREALAALSVSLRLHQRREDLVLYPVCERLFGGEGGAASVLREGHVAIAEQLDALVRESEAAGRVSRGRLEVLRNELDDHFGKEERVLFPLTAALLSGTESSSLARRLRAPRPARPRARV